MKNFLRASSLCSVFLILTVTAFAQLSNGSMTGTVTDPSGAAIPGAAVTATQTSSGRVTSTVTTSAGLYAFPSLDVGAYTITVEKAGFKKLTRSGATVSVSSRTVVDGSLELGDVSQSVTILADGPQLQTASTEIGTTFTQKMFRDAPISAGGIRSPEAFIGFQPGVTNGAGGEGGISGGARRSKEILIDGAGATNPESGGIAFNGLPSVEGIGEFKLINNTFAAEYGRTGGGIESFITASGGNQFHGNAFDFHTSSALSAAAWASKANTVGTTPFRKTPYHGNEYGFALGGPVYLPKKLLGPLGGYNESKTKTFFFFTLDNFRRTDSSSAFYNLPTAKQRTGDFSELLPGRVIYDPLTGQPFAGNIIPTNRFSAVTKNVLPLIPAVTSAALTQNFLGTRATKSKQDSWSLKINQNFGEKHLLSVYHTYQNLGVLYDGPLPTPLFGAALTQTGTNRPIFTRFNYDWIITPAMNLHVTYGITKLRQYFDNASVGQGWPQKLGLKGVTQTVTDAFPVINFATNGYLNYADTNGTKTKGSQFNFTKHFRADLSWVKGNFNWKFGADHRWMSTTGEALPSGAFDDAGVQGVFNSALQTANPVGATGGDSFASFLLGLVDNANRTYNGPGIAAKFGYNAWYAQADWKIRPNLTVNLGMRYELPVPRHTNPVGAFTSFDPNITDPRSGLKGALAYLGDCAGCNGKSRFGDIDKTSIGPRLGLAWSLNQKTVIRAGYGIYYAAGNGLMGGFCLRCATGFASSAAVSKATTTSAALNWDNGFVPPATFIPPPTVSPSAGNQTDDIYYINPKSGTAPRFQNWSLSVQRELPFKIVAEAAYIGNRGTRLSANHFSLNLLDPKFYALGTLLNAEIDSKAVTDAGYKIPYANFIADWRGTGTAGATLARALRPYPQINGPIADEYNPVGSSWYDSLQIKLDRRFGSLFVEANYTWSKSLTNASGSQTGGDSNNRNPKTDRSISTLGQEGVLAFEKSLQYTDYPHIANLVAVVDLPFGKGKKFLNNSGLLDRVFGGWTVSFTGNYTSGALILLNATNTYPNYGFAYGRKRVNIVAGKAILSGVKRQDIDPRAGLISGVRTRSSATPWLNNDFFSIPGAYELGNSPTYLSGLRDPNNYSDSMGFIKRTRLSETVSFELRGEFFNIFNRTNFGLGGTPNRPNVNDLINFGIPGGPRTGARVGQMAAKINF
jgi:hypothetical protein